MPSIKVIDLNFNLVAIIDDYLSFFFTRKWSSAGDFQIDIENLKHADVLARDMIIFTDPKKPFIIEALDIDYDEEKITASGRQLKSILDRRITYPPAGQGYHKITGPVETIMKEYVNSNAGLAALTSRVIQNLIVADDQARGISTAYQTRYKILPEELEILSRMSGVGYDITLDLDIKKFKFETYLGVDRTAGQTENSRVIFSKDFDNITNHQYKEDSKAYRNTAIVGGQGEDENREIVEVSTDEAGSSLDRREIFIDARDIDDGANLTERGKAKLSEYRKTVLLDTEVENRPFIYGQDYDLGDIVTIIERSTGLYLDTRVNEVTEKYDAQGDLINPTFGDNLVPTINDIFKRAQRPLIETKREVLSDTQPTLATGDEWLKII